MKSARRRLERRRNSHAAGGILLVIALALSTGACSDTGAEQMDARRSTAVSFTDVTEASGLSEFRYERGAAGDLWFPEINGSGVAFIDYDGDGWYDLLIAGGGTWPSSGMEPVDAVALYQNNRDGTFTRRTDAAGLADVHAFSYGFAVADYDNDGDQDFYLTTVDENRLFANENGRFTEVASEAGSQGPAEWSNSAAFFDADRDGLLDLLVTNYVVWAPDRDIPCMFGNPPKKDYCTPLAYPGLPPRYYYNDGGRFVDRTREAGFYDSPGKSMGIALLDHNQDGWLDVAMSNDGEPDHLFENDGDGTFTDKGFVSGMALNSRGQPQAGMGIDAGDITGSGREAVVVGNFANETIGLFQYEGGGLFADQTRAAGVGAPSMRSLTFGVLLFDADLDGFQDIFTANGHISLFADEDGDEIGVRQVPHLFMNDGDGSFTDVAASIPALSIPRLGRGAAYADYDRDGDLDIVLTENVGGIRLFRNDLRSNRGSDAPNYLRLTLVGHTSNASGIGAKATAYVGGRALMRRVRTGSSYLSQSELPLTFGLGSATHLDSLVVSWPSGDRQWFADVEANRAYTLEEGSEHLRQEAFAER